MLRVAIASENSDTDSEIYRVLLELVLKRPVERFDSSPAGFTGWKTVYRLAGAFLGMAWKAGVRHALIAIDNDGGAIRYPEHIDGDEPFPAGTDLEKLVGSLGCRYCSLAAVVPEAWRVEDRCVCVVVPIQTLETWVLYVNGYSFKTATPEQQYHRSFLKRECYGAHASAAKRRKKALEAFRSPGALQRLRDLRSFQRFESAVGSWNVEASSS